MLARLLLVLALLPVARPARGETPSTDPDSGRKVVLPTGEPLPADWGNPATPLRPWESDPPVDYRLVGPPRGVIQSTEGHEFEQVVSRPEEIFHHGPEVCPGIDLDRPDGLAPIGVFGDHTLNAGGEFLVSYRFSTTQFNGNRDGTNEISTGQILAAYPIAPERMVAQRHALLIEYAPTDDLTVLALLPFWQLSIDHMTRAGTGIHSATTDPGDLILQALYLLWREDRQQVHLNLGLQLPTGVEEWERSPPAPGSPDASYPLRNASGTWEFMPGATYRGQTDDWTWGGQAMGTIRLGINNSAYKLGDRVDLTAWLARRLTENFSLSGRLDGNLWGNVFGADPQLDQALVPTNRPDLQGGRRLDILFGINAWLPGGCHTQGHWFSVEGGVPVYQSLTGPQLEADWMLHAGYNLRF